LNLSLGQITIANHTGSTVLQPAICLQRKLIQYFGFNSLLEQLPGPFAQQICQRIGTPRSTFQVNNVNLIHGGVSLWLFDCVVTSNQPDTPPFFKYLNTRFGYNSPVCKLPLIDGANSCNSLTK
jgi:hypothetical protein